VLAKHVEAQELNPSLPKIENSSRARRAYSIFFTEVAGMRQHLQEEEKRKAGVCTPDTFLS